MPDEEPIAAKLDREFIDLMIEELNGQSRRKTGEDSPDSPNDRRTAEIGDPADWLEERVIRLGDDIADEATPADPQLAVEDENVATGADPLLAVDDESDTSAADSQPVVDDENDKPEPAPEPSARGKRGVKRPREKILLEIIEPKHRERVFRLHRKPVVIGRGREADITVRDTKVSRQHIRIELDEGHVMIRDLNSQNGTKVNDRTIQEAEVIPGNEITIGRTTIRVKWVSR